MIWLKQSTASQEIPLGYFLDATDADTEETALVIANTDIKLWKTGATTLANKNSGGATHISNGIYYTVLDATDTDTLGPLHIFVHVAGALAVKVQCMVLAANVYDALVGATDKLQVDTVEVTGTAQTARDLGGTLGVAGAGLTAVPWNAAWDAEVQSECADALVAYDPPTHAELIAEVDAVQADIVALNDLDAAGIRAAVGLTAANLDTQLAAIDDAVDTETGTIIANLATVDTVVDAIKAKTDQLGFTGTNVNAEAKVVATGAIDDNAMTQAAEESMFTTWLAMTVDTGITWLTAFRGAFAVMLGRATGGGTGTEVFRNAGTDTKARVTSENDGGGNRTNVTVDGT